MSKEKRNRIIMYAIFMVINFMFSSENKLCLYGGFGSLGLIIFELVTIGGKEEQEAKKKEGKI